MVLSLQDSLNKYLAECKDTPFDLSNGPSCLSLDEDSSKLVINAPNYVSVIGEYTFYINIWKITLNVEAPCASNYLQGLEVEGHITVTIDR